MSSFRKGFVPLLPVLLLIALATGGIANALQDEEYDVPFDRGPQPGDFQDEAGEADITGYLIGTSNFASAPYVYIDEVFDFRIFSCVEGDPLAISIIPRQLTADEAAYNEDLAEEDLDDAFLTETTLLWEGDALASGSAYPVEIPRETPLTFSRIHVACTDDAGDEIETETYVDLIRPEWCEDDVRLSVFGDEDADVELGDFPEDADADDEGDNDDPRFAYDDRDQFVPCYTILDEDPA